MASAVDKNLKAYELGRAQYEVGKIDLLSLLRMQTHDPTHTFSVFASAEVRRARKFIKVPGALPKVTSF